MVMPRCRGKNRFGLNRIESQLVGILVGPLPVASPVGFNPLVQINRLRRCIYRCSYEWIHLHIFSVNWVFFATQRWNPKSNGVILIQRTNVFTTMERYISHLPPNPRRLLDFSSLKPICWKLKVTHSEKECRISRVYWYHLPTMVDHGADCTWFDEPV